MSYLNEYWSKCKGKPFKALKVYLAKSNCAGKKKYNLVLYNFSSNSVKKHSNTIDTSMPSRYTIKIYKFRYYEHPYLSKINTQKASNTCIQHEYY